MSKHGKHVRRERRKTERSRCRPRGRRLTRPLCHSATVLVAAGALAAGTQAYAAPIRINNSLGPNYWDWDTASNQNLRALDITLPPADQPADPANPASVIQFLAPLVSKIGGIGGTTELQTGVGFPEHYFAVGVDAETLIPTADTSWTRLAYAGAYYGYPSLLTVGVETYLGVRFDLGSGWQYGWIGVVMTPQATLDAFAWGYETEPGVPIAAGAPEPGSLALLAFGAVGVAARRRSGKRQINVRDRRIGSEQA